MTSPRAIYIGIRSPGTTSRLRSDTLIRTLPRAVWSLIDTDIAFRSASRLSRSLAFRLRIGPAVRAINEYVLDRLPTEPVKLVWVDKGVCLWPATVQKLRELAETLIYYTPDTSFLHNRSQHFFQTINLYDRVVTTKSLEVPEFHRRMDPAKLLLVPQSYDRNLHYPRVAFEQKRNEAVLVGLCEPYREECVARLLDAGVAVRIGGHGWERFLRRRQRELLLTFDGKAVFGESYAETLSKAAVGLGVVTQRFAELHTTRTFEIPACGTALATPDNAEVRTYFAEDEAIYFRDLPELTTKVSALMQDREQLLGITKRGYERVLDSGCNNEEVIRDILESAGIDLEEEPQN